MSNTKPRQRRPRRVRYPNTVGLNLSDDDYRRVCTLAEIEGCSAAEVAREVVSAAMPAAIDAARKRAQRRAARAEGADAAPPSR